MNDNNSLVPTPSQEQNTQNNQNVSRPKTQGIKTQKTKKATVKVAPQIANQQSTPNPSSTTPNTNNTSVDQAVIVINNRKKLCKIFSIVTYINAVLALLLIILGIIAAFGSQTTALSQGSIWVGFYTWTIDTMEKSIASGKFSGLGFTFIFLYAILTISIVVQLLGNLILKNKVYPEYIVSTTLILFAAETLLLVLGVCSTSHVDEISNGSYANWLFKIKYPEGSDTIGMSLSTGGIVILIEFIGIILILIGKIIYFHSTKNMKKRIDKFTQKFIKSKSQSVEVE